MTYIERFIEKHKNIMAKMLIDTDMDSESWKDVTNWVRGAKTILSALEEDYKDSPEWLLMSGLGEPWRYKCSFCHSEVTDLRLDGETPDFCPYCGAYMKGRRKERIYEQ